MAAVEQIAARPGFRALRDQIVALADPRESCQVLDVGAGTGLLTLAIAPHVTHVWALDVSPAMCDHLRGVLAADDLTNVGVVTGDATRLPFQNAAFDLVVSNYCLHHLTHAGKRHAIAEIRRVLRPGGQIVIGDMMFELGLGTTRGRTVLRRFASTMIRRGPAGILRLTTNLARAATGRGEHPAGMPWWRHELTAAGFVEINARECEHEGGIVAARAPA
ncbi:MAG: class I SAM-dependent methyltransferase [Solirubrobacteraceae bacterium]